MRAINRIIDRFCAKHRRFGIPNLMRYVVFLSAAVFLIFLMDRTGGLLYFLYFNPTLIMRGEVWRLISWVLIPLNDNILFTALMLYFYYFIGGTLEREWGTARFTIYYILGMLLNIIYASVLWFVLRSPVYLAPNFLNLSMFFAFAALYPDHRVMLFFFIPIKMKWMALINLIFFAYSIISNIVIGQIASAFLPIIALLNFVIMCGVDLLQNLRPYSVSKTRSTINFKKASKQARKIYDERNFRHKCIICGKTDTENPGTEFRYCSRCEGYHCYCIDHINNHVHIR